MKIETAVESKLKFRERRRTFERRHVQSRQRPQCDGSVGDRSPAPLLLALADFIVARNMEALFFNVCQNEWIRNTWN